MPGHHVNGALTVGENIGDLGGLTIALLAYELSLRGQEPAVIDGLSGRQRLFRNWAFIWRVKRRPELALQRSRSTRTQPSSAPTSCATWTSSTRRDRTERYSG